MEGRTINYIRGHMGGDEVIFIQMDRTIEGQELSLALSIFDFLESRTFEIAFVYPMNIENEIKLKIVDSSSRMFVPMCGGVTQVLGRILMEKKMAHFVGIHDTQKSGENKWILVTDSGYIPLRALTNTLENNIVIETDMTSYIHEIEKRGIYPLTTEGIRAYYTGEFIVLDECILQNIGADPWKQNKKFLQLIHELQRKLLNDHIAKSNCISSAAYRQESNNSKNLTATYRFIPDAPKTNFACGTGAISIARTLLEEGKLPLDGDEVELIMRVYSEPSDTLGYSKVRLKVKNGNILNVTFMHSLVEIIESGMIELSQHFKIRMINKKKHYNYKKC